MPDVFAAIADPTRRVILDMLTKRPMSAGEIGDVLPRLSQPGVSRHLRILRDGGLVDVQTKAQQRIYTVKPEGMMELYEWVAKYQAMWPQTLDALERFLAAEEQAARKKARTKKRNAKS